MKDEKRKGQGFILHPSAFILRLRRMLRGEISVRTVAQEAKRRLDARQAQRRERASLPELERQPAHLTPEFARLSPTELLAHFRSRQSPQFFPGFSTARQTAGLQLDLFPDESAELMTQARRIATEHRWSVLGLGEKCFGAGEIDWNLDPLTNTDWPLAYHADINLMRNDGSDARVLWELNRLAHLVTLGRAYAISSDEVLSNEFFRQVVSWRAQNPVGFGVNWNCAMEVALRSMNLLGAFMLFLDAPEMNERALADLLRMFDQHGAHIRRNLEFSHIATSNHYLSDVTGLLWLGLMLPELAAAAEWRKFGLRELFSELEKQVLPDGADYEAATGYHRLMLELFLYSFVLCHINGIQIEEKYWTRLRGMVAYLRAYLRPDGRAPLIGDSDSGQAFSIKRRSSDDHAYVLALGAAMFQEPGFKAAGLSLPEELLWILGAQGVRDFASLAETALPQSQAFPDAGTYVLRDDDLYLLFNASGNGVNGRGSHGHNDALSIEVSAGGVPFIVDPGTYVYTADLKERQLFRSTAYHSTVQVDEAEQNTTLEETPFVMGDEAHPRVLEWETNSERDVVTAEHDGYQRLSSPVSHRRTVFFNKLKHYWLVSDKLTGAGTHDISFRFHFAPGLQSSVRPDGFVDVCDKMSGSRLLIQGTESRAPFVCQVELENDFSSGDYGAKVPSTSVRWSARTVLPFEMSFAIIPIRAGENEAERIEMSLAWPDD